jgi:hypothetical protein
MFLQSLEYHAVLLEVHLFVVIKQIYPESAAR